MDTPHHNPGGPRKRADRPHLPLRDLLAAAANTRRTRLELLYFELNMNPVRGEVVDTSSGARIGAAPSGAPSISWTAPVWSASR